jgi:hypothetical protein
VSQEGVEQSKNLEHANSDADSEFAAMSQIYSALKPLDEGGRKRVLDYVLSRLDIRIIPKLGETKKGDESPVVHKVDASDRSADESLPKASLDVALDDVPDEIEGISAVAKKWMKRTGLSGEKLSALYSLGVDEIDLVANSVPGQTTKDRLRSLMLLEGVASYLGTGAPRVEYNRLKTAMGHYGIDPGTNLSTYLKTFAAEATGTASAGFTLTARGLNSATELIKEMVGRK